MDRGRGSVPCRTLRSLQVFVVVWCGTWMQLTTDFRVQPSTAEPPPRHVTRKHQQVDCAGIWFYRVHFSDPDYLRSAAGAFRLIAASSFIICPLILNESMILTQLVEPRRQDEGPAPVPRHVPAQENEMLINEHWHLQTHTSARLEKSVHISPEVRPQSWSWS